MRKLVIFGAIIGGAILLAFLSSRSGTEALLMRMAEVERGRVATSVLSSGTVNYREIIKLRTEVTGRIEQLTVKEGDTVSKGDVLVVISPERFEADVAQQRALVKTREIAIERQKVFLAQLNRKQNRQQELHKTGVVNTDLYENTQRDVAMAKLDLQSREQDLQQTKALFAQAMDRLSKTAIKAPIDGIITALNVKIGETVVAGTTNIIGSSIMDVSDPSAVLAEVKVEETDILAVQLGQEAKIMMASVPDGHFNGKVISIGTTARKDPNGRNQFLVKLLVEKSTDQFLRLAISCRAEIFTKIVEGALQIPVEAVLQEDRDGDQTGDDYVFVEDSGTAKKVMIDKGIQTDTSVEIKGGLKEGDTLIVGPYRLLKNLKDGQAVKDEGDSEDDGSGDGDA